MKVSNSDGSERVCQYRVRCLTGSGVVCLSLEGEGESSAEEAGGHPILMTYINLLATENCESTLEASL